MTAQTPNRPHADQEVVELLRQEMREGFERVEGVIAQILSQAKITNGRVTKQELQQSYIKGAIAMLLFLLGLPAVVATTVGMLQLLPRG